MRTLTVNYLMARIEAKPTCECCGVAASDEPFICGRCIDGGD